MNKYLLTIGVLCAINVSKAQDVIVKKDGSTVMSKVLEVNQDDIKYKKYSNLDGPTYTIYKKEIASINYENFLVTKKIHNKVLVAQKDNQTSLSKGIKIR